MKEINQELTAGSYALASAGTTTTVVTNATTAARNFRIGDGIGVYDSSGSAAIDLATTSSKQISTISSGTITADGAFSSSLNVDVNDVAAVRERAGLTSIDDVTWDGNTTVGAATGYVQNVRYNMAGSMAAGAWNAPASVQMNAGVGRDLSLNLLDTSIQKIRENGGEPKLLLMGHDQYFKLERLLNSQQRYMGQEEYQVGIGSERTFPGTRTGLVLATYMGIPILPDADIAKSQTASTGAAQGSMIYALDTDFLEIAIAQPTQYIENRDYFAANQLVVRGLLYTMGELRCRNFFVQAKIGNLNA
tara:strand:- start:1 stop:915 length:915 start_codon:yes stop_codon:yes gene_type:complete